MLTWLIVLVGLLNAILGVTVFRRTQKGSERLIFLMMLLSVAFWSWGLAVFMIAGNPERAQLYANIYYLAAMFIAANVFTFSLYGAGVRSRIVLVSAYIPSVAWALMLLFVPRFIIHVQTVFGSFSSRVELVPVVYTLYSLTFCAYVVAALIRLYTTALKSHEKARRRLLLIAHGMLVSILGGTVFDLILPGLGLYDLIYIGPLFSIFFAITATYSIERYSWFDLRQSFLLSIVYVISFVVIAGVYGILAFLAGKVISDGVHDTYVIALINSAVMLVAVLLFQPIRRLFDQATDKVFFRHEYQTSELLAKLSQIIAHTIRLDGLVGRVASMLSEGIKPVFVQVLITDQTGSHSRLVGSAKHDMQPFLSEISRVFDDEQNVRIFDASDHINGSVAWVAENGVAAVVRMHSSRGVVGYIVFGEKRSGIMYSQKDKDFLQVAADEIALAVENSLRYEVIKNFSDTLKERVDEATDELRQTNKKLKQMDQTKDEFISLTSHQLRTPLTTIKGYISMLLDGDAGEVSPQQRKLLEEAFNSSQRMVHLISDFLNISRIQTGKFVIELTDVNLADILDEEIEQLRVSAASRQLKLSYDKPSNFPTMKIDEGKIRQVMMNFIDNAIYYSPSGSTIDIFLTSSGAHVEFRVVDQGIGVPKAEQHKLFTKFSRASNARKQRPDGTGIGLFMAKKVVVALGGALIFRSQENKGSTFGFRLNL